MSLILRANNGAPLTWDQMDNNLLYLESIAGSQSSLTLQNVTDNGSKTTNDITVVDNAASPILLTTLTFNSLNFYNNGNGNTITLSTPQPWRTTSVNIQLPDKTGTIALLSDVASAVVGGIATASVTGGAGQKMAITHNLGYTPSFALATPINASSSLIPYYVSYTELNDTFITIRYPTTIADTLVGYSYIVK